MASDGKLAIVGERLAGMAVVWRFWCDRGGGRGVHRLVTPDSCHCGCVLVVAVVVCDSGRGDRQGSGGEGREHVGGRKMDGMKDWGRGAAVVCHVVVVVSVWSWLSVLFRFFWYRTFYVWVAVTHGLVDTERTHAIYLIMQIRIYVRTQSWKEA